jgi:hypothetical protein
MHVSSLCLAEALLLASCTGQTLADLNQQLTDEQWSSIDIMINCGVGKFAGKRDDIQVFDTSTHLQQQQQQQRLCVQQCSWATYFYAR